MTTPRRRMFSGMLIALVTGGVAILTCSGPAGAAGTTATVKTGSTPLKIRNSSNTRANVVGSLRREARITINCYVFGETVHGVVRTSNQWDQLASGGYVAHAYVSSGSIPACSQTNAQLKAVPTNTTRSSTATGTSSGSGQYNAMIRTTDGSLRVRSSASTTGPVLGQLPDRTGVTLVCSTSGTVVAGTVRTSGQWDQLSTGGYVSHAYVDTSATLPTCKTPSLGSSSTPSSSNAQFIATAVQSARSTRAQYRIPVSVTVAQAIIESGWGRSGLSVSANNYFGIKCSAGKFGSIASGCTPATTTECAGNVCGLSVESFRRYSSMENSFRDHGLFLAGNSRYRNAFKYPDKPDQFIAEVWKAGYATSPTYVQTIVNTMQKYNLYQYD